MLRSNSPSGRTSSGISEPGRTGRPSTRTRCRPTANAGTRRARATASAAAGPATIKLAHDRIPCRCASSTASLTAMSRPKSSAQTITCFTVLRHPSPPSLSAWSPLSRTAGEGAGRSEAGEGQLASSRVRRNWKNSTPSRSRRRIISGLLIISASSEAILPRRK
jgi:hypothetical protein